MIQRIWGTYKGERPFESEIDLRHPWTSVMLGFWSFDEGGGAKAYDSIDVNHGVFGAGAASPTWINTSFGKAVNFVGASSQFIAPTFTATPNLMTVACAARLDSAGSFPMFVSWSAKHELRGSGSTGQPEMLFRASDNASVTATSATNISGDGKYHCLSGSYDGNNTTFYLDGKNPVSSAHAAVGLQWPAGPLCFGIRNSVSQQLSGSILWVAIWGRALTAAEHVEIGAHPNAIRQIYRRRRRQVVYPKAYLLTAARGIFVETGNAANLLYGRRLAASTGTFVEIGVAANLLYSRRLVASAGVFTETGNAANLLYGRRLIASAGSFTETGRSANLLYGRRLIASAGSFVETGNAAGLYRGYRLTASAGTFVETGHAASLIYVSVAGVRARRSLSDRAGSRGSLMQGYEILKDSAAYPLVFPMIDSTNHIDGKTGLTPNVIISKNGGVFAAPAGAISEIGSGLYKVAGNAIDSNTLGPIVLHATAPGADPTDMLYPVIGGVPVNNVDSIMIETGLNLRQAISIIAAFAAGTGGPSSALYRGAGVAATRISYTASAGDRSAVALNPPA